MVVAWLVPCETAAVSHHFMHRVHAYLAVTCHLHFWWNDRGLLCATVVTCIPKQEFAQKVAHGEENSPSVLAGT